MIKSDNSTPKLDKILSLVVSLQHSLHTTQASVENLQDIIDKRFVAIDKRFITLEKKVDVLDMKIEIVNRKIDRSRDDTIDSLTELINHGYNMLEDRVIKLEKHTKLVS